jgi:cyclopropane fatty-acyl-phospholipid synthase-like methyltransferase
MTKLEKWSKYWEDLQTPLHRSNGENFYPQYAAELKILLKDSTPRRVLELGCGNGDLYQYMDFDKADLYKGVDFSAAMLADFHQKYPHVELECGDASAYRDDRQYDLIWSNGVIQYFDYKMLANNFANVKSMMNKDSVFVCASVPWKLHKFPSMTGESYGIKKNVVKGMANYVKNIFKDSMGTWYDLDAIRELAAANSMSVEFFASMHYMYRFHVVLKLV